MALEHRFGTDLGITATAILKCFILSFCVLYMYTNLNFHPIFYVEDTTENHTIHVVHEICPLVYFCQM